MSHRITAEMFLYNSVNSLYSTVINDAHRISHWGLYMWLVSPPVSVIVLWWSASLSLLTWQNMQEAHIYSCFRRKCSIKLKNNSNVSIVKISSEFSSDKYQGEIFLWSMETTSLVCLLYIVFESVCPLLIYNTVIDDKWSCLILLRGQTTPNIEIKYWWDCHIVIQDSAIAFCCRFG